MASTNTSAISSVATTNETGSGAQNKKIVDGCTAAAYVAYAMSEVATVYPITPIAEMGQTAQKWALDGIKNFAGNALEVREMESELGAAGATHGALVGGALATTFTSSQGLLLMIPNMYKMAGELLPAVFHVGCRSVATQALSIFGDHSDVMACRATGFAILASASVQEAMDLALVSHLAAIEGRVPVLHMMDGWRTSNEMASIEMIPYGDMFGLMDKQKVAEFRSRAMNPEHPDLRGSAQNPDVYFQNREACNPYYDAFGTIVEEQMKRVGDLTGRHYSLFDYVGDPQAEFVIVTMGSSCQVVELTIDELRKQGYKVGLVKVRLYRPFLPEKLMDAIPQSVKRIAVLDRTKEPGSNGEPLFQDVATAVLESERPIRVIGGRYGLSSKEFDPTMVKAVFDNLASSSPQRRFTVGIDDDVTHLSLPLTDRLDIDLPGVTQAQFYGMGSDGTVGATKQAANIIGNAPGYYAQAYFQYSAKKSGGYTVSQLRIGREPIMADYSIEQADYVGCNKDTYVRRFDLVDNLKEGGTFVLMSHWSAADMDRELPAALRRKIAQKHARFYTIDAQAVAARHNLGVRVNMIMETVFMHLLPIIPFEHAYAGLQEQIKKNYAHEGGQVVADNLAAIAEAVDAIVAVDYPDAWLTAEDAPAEPTVKLPRFVAEVASVCNRLEGNRLPVSMLRPDGIMPLGTTAYEKRGIAIDIPRWDPQKCIQCTQCSLVCAHAAIRPYLLDADEKAGAPADLSTIAAKAPALKDLQWRIQVYPLDCTGCSSCATICPGHALTMVPMPGDEPTQTPLLEYCQQHVTLKEDLLPRTTVPGSQLCQPLLEFSGACAGCGETPYVKLITQLFGQRMVIANATGCSSIWGGDFPSNSYTSHLISGHGPAWGNSLFEDNAEYGYGIATAMNYRRAALIEAVKAIASDATADASVVSAAKAWLAEVDDPDRSMALGRQLLDAVKAQGDNSLYQPIIDGADLLGKKSVWAIGGDGWAYDIGFAGVDHVLAQNIDLNMFVMDTECYSNTGGQASKATPLGCVAKYAPDGKRTYKKDLGRMMMTYGTVYVASVCLGANYGQTIKALVEAEAYPGPSLVIAYCPCIEHGIRAGMGHDILTEREAVLTGYWPLYRYDPRLAAQGKNPLQIDAPAPGGHLDDFLAGQDRYADLAINDPSAVNLLHNELATRLDHLYELMKATSQITLPQAKDS